MKREDRIPEALKHWGFEDVRIMEQFHEESARLRDRITA